MRLLYLVLLCVFVGRAAACERGQELKLAFKDYDVSLQMPSELRAKTLISFCGELKCRTNICPEIISVFADARMPQHSHGMTTAPSVQRAKGEFIINGLYFQMSGSWELSIDLQTGGIVERQKAEIIIP